MYEKKKIAKIKKKPGAETRPLLVRGRYCLKNIQKKKLQQKFYSVKIYIFLATTIC